MKSPRTFEAQSGGDVELSETLCSSLPDLASSSPNVVKITESNLNVASNGADISPKPDSLFCMESEPGISSSISVTEAGPTPESPVGNGKAEKPVDSLSEWLDIASSETLSPEIQSSRTEESVGLSPGGMVSIP